MEIPRRAVLAAGPAVLLGAAAGFASRAAEPQSRGMVLGVQTHLSQGWPRNWLDTGKSIGATSFRDGLSWKVIEKQAGVYKFDPYDVDYLDLARRKGLDLLLTVDPRHPAYDDGRTAYSEPARIAYANYLSAVLDRYGDVVSAIEVGNELNGGEAMALPSGVDKASAHVLLLKTVWERVKPAHPKVAILGGSTNVIGTGFLKAIFKAGGLDVMDGVAVHPYRSQPEHVDDELRVLTETMKRYGPVRPIYATEFSDQFLTPEMASPHMLKMAVLMGSVHVERAYWYALSDQKWFRNMGLFTSQGATKPGADTFALLQRDVLGHGDPVRIPADSRTFIYRYPTGLHVMWGASRPITWSGRPRVRDARGKILAPPTLLDDRPVVVDGDFSFDLGPDPVVADSFLEYGAAPWSYHAETGDGARRPLARIDWDWTSYIGDRRFGALRINPESLAPAGNGDKPVRAVVAYTATEAGPLRVALELKGAGKGGDGVDFRLLLNDQVLASQIVTDQLKIDQQVDLKVGDRLYFVFGPNAKSGGDSIRYRIRLWRGGKSRGDGANLAPDTPNRH